MVKRQFTGLLGLMVLSTVLLAHPVRAQPSNDEQRRAEFKASADAANAAAKPGPADIPLLDQARLTLPAGMEFIPSTEAIRLMHAMGNQAGPNLVGIVDSTGPANWIVTITWNKAGYVRDDEAAELNPGDILASLREGTEAGNVDRRTRGFPEIEVQDWIEPPRYDTATHRLSWAVPVVETVSRSGSVNFNTRDLGREGYFSVNLLGEPARLEADRPVAAAILSALEYLPGKRYEDFNASTDHVAEFGLAALIGVVAAKKLGLLALGAAFLVKFAKVGLVAVAGVGLALRRMFRRKPSA